MAPTLTSSSIFLMPRDAEITRNTPPLISQFAVQSADGADLALRFHQMVAVEGHMPDGDRNPCQHRGGIDPGPFSP